MAKGSGGTRGGGASGRSGGGGKSSAPSTVFTGGWTGSDKDTAEIIINGINKQTEKAINVKTLVDWAKGSAHVKDIWVPKSTISKITSTPIKGLGGKDEQRLTLYMKKSMAQSIGKQNNFKGYDMDFVNGYNVWG